jgi:hypothetical protein
MTFEIALEDFRGFHRQEYLPIRPITILVGENSAGKTSFLAGLKFMLDFFSARGTPSFNGDPFQLGTFDQIAHYRGGRGGRAKEFKMSVRQSVKLKRDREPNVADQFTVDVQLSFESIESHAGIGAVRISSQRQIFEILFTSKGVETSLINEKNERFPIGEPSSSPPLSRADFARYWPFLLRDLRYRLRSSLDEKQQTLFADPSDSVSRFSDLVDEFSIRLPRVIEATSAIRTRPQRTYTPGTEQYDGEGTHVPYEIAKLYRSKSRENSEWTKIKGALEDFGTQSEMFKEISVKSFGQTASDPFQLQFSSDGPRTNLADLGYGTSQVLPILYSVARAQRPGFFLIQQPEVHLHPKAQAALGDFFVTFNRSMGARFVLETHSDFIVDRVRRSISRGVLDKEDVSILFFQRERLENRITQIRLDDHGEPIKPPSAYRAFFIGEQLKILGL